MFNLSSLSGLQLFQLLRYGAFILLGVGFAQLGLAPEVISMFETFLLISGLISFFWVSGLINTLMSLYPKAEQGKQPELLFQFFVLLTGFGWLAGMLIGLGGTLLPDLLRIVKIGDYSVSTSGWLIGGYIALSAPTFLVEYILYLHKKERLLVFYALFSSLATLAALMCAAYLSLHNTVLFPAYFSKALYALAAVKYLFLAVLLGKFADFKLELKIVSLVLSIATPILLSILLSGSSEYVDGMLIKWKMTDVDFSIYRYGAKELPILLIMANTFSVAMVSVIASNRDKGITQLRFRSTRMMHLFFPLTIVLMLLSLPLYELVFTQQFSKSAFIFNIYLLLIIPRLLFPQTILTALHHTKYLFYSASMELALNVVLSLILLHYMGLPGIALATFMAACVDKSFLMYIAANKFGISPDNYINFNWYTIYSVLTVFAFMVSYWVYFI